MKRNFPGIFTTISALLCINIAQAEEFGPYYISYDDFCEVYEIYLTSEMNIYGREIGCERESAVITGNYEDKGARSKIYLHFSDEDGVFTDVISIRTGNSKLYYSDGSAMEQIVKSRWNFSDRIPSE